MPHTLLTTTIGAWPKPDQVPIRDWFAREGGTDTSEPTSGYAETVRQYGDRLTAILDHATREVVREQDELGIDVPTDGEVRRENHVHYHCRHLRGIDFRALSEMQKRGQTVWLPTITARIEADREPFLVRDWEVAQSATRKPVKITLPGPMTIGESLTDAFYEGDVRRRGADLADALNVEVRRLADAGCPWIQIDEPMFARRSVDGLAFGIDHLERAFHRVPREVRRVLHVCCGYPDRLDPDEDDPKAPREAYHELADALDEANVDVISIEDAHRPNDLTLLERFRRSALILGVIAIARSRVEEVDEIRDRLRAALEHIDPDRLIVGPDCGLGLLGRDLTRRKLQAMVEAARTV